LQILCIKYEKFKIQIYILRYFFSLIWINLVYLWIYKPFLNIGIERFKIDKEWVEFIEKDLLLKFIKGFNLNNIFK